MPLFVFDLDGTLVDSRRDIADAANALLVECGAPALAEETVGRLVGDGVTTLVARAFAAADRPQPPGAIQRFLELYDARLLIHTRPYPRVVDVLGALAGRATLALLTNKPMDAARRVLAGLDLARFFPADRIVGGDGPFPRKPDPAGLRYLLAAAGAAPADAVLVGDSVVDWQVAGQASVRACLARYGFGFEGFPIECLRGTEWLIDSPDELLDGP